MSRKRNRLRLLEQSIGKRALTVIDMRDDAEVANVLEIVGHPMGKETGIRQKWFDISARQGAVPSRIRGLPGILTEVLTAILRRLSDGSRWLRGERGVGCLSRATVPVGFGCAWPARSRIRLSARRHSMPEPRPPERAVFRRRRPRLPCRPRSISEIGQCTSPR
jgi:hypothetical protein